MILGTLKLDTQDIYVYGDDSLPVAPKWDKEMLTYLVGKNTITEDGHNILPDSMRKISNTAKYEPTLAIKVSEIDALADLLIVTRVSHRGQSGKKFRFTNFEPLTKTGMIEIWKRK